MPIVGKRMVNRDILQLINLIDINSKHIKVNDELSILLKRRLLNLLLMMFCSHILIEVKLLELIPYLKITLHILLSLILIKITG